MWGVVKKCTFAPQNETKLMLDLFFILHFIYLGCTHPTHPLPTGLVVTSSQTDRPRRNIGDNGPHLVLHKAMLRPNNGTNAAFRCF